MRNVGNELLPGGFHFFQLVRHLVTGDCQIDNLVVYFRPNNGTLFKMPLRHFLYNTDDAFNRLRKHLRNHDHQQKHNQHHNAYHQVCFLGNVAYFSLYIRHRV